MIYNLDKILTGFAASIPIDSAVTFDDQHHHKDIIRLNDVYFTGEITTDSDDEIKLIGTLRGIMVILDSISLAEVDYHFSIDIDENIAENIEKNKNTIDILEILWQNIVLEVPLRYTTVTDYSSYCGDGWKLISEEELHYTNNPFQALIENEKEE